MQTERQRQKVPQPNPKWLFAIGTTSFVPGARWLDATALHYLILDVDQYDYPEDTVMYLCREIGCRNLRVAPTNRGWHIYTDKMYRWRDLLALLRTIPHVDQRWVSIGSNRGYLYLADKQDVQLHWPVVRMMLHYVKKGRKGNT
jgi:hypothetical protein